MPSRRQNRKTSEERQLLAVKCTAASVIQEYFRWYRRSRCRISITQSDHLRWHRASKKGSSIPGISDPQRSCLIRRHAGVSRQVTWGRITFHESPNVSVRESGFHKELCCRICLQLCNAPMFSECCPSASNYGCVCYGCAYSFLQLDIKSKDRKPVRSWSPTCTNGCHIKPCRSVLKPLPESYSAQYYTEVQLQKHVEYHFFDRLRDEFGSSACFACSALFETTAALRRHMQLCGRISTHCPYCDFFGTRREIITHHITEHEFVTCPCCQLSVKATEWSQHAQAHKDELNRNLISNSGRFFITPGGKMDIRINHAGRMHAPFF